MIKAINMVKVGMRVPASEAKSGAHFLPSFSLRSLGEGGRVQNYLSESNLKRGSLI